MDVDEALAWARYEEAVDVDPLKLRDAAAALDRALLELQGRVLALRACCASAGGVSRSTAARVFAWPAPAALDSYRVGERVTFVADEVLRAGVVASEFRGGRLLVRQFSVVDGAAVPGESFEIFSPRMVWAS